MRLGAPAGTARRMLDARFDVLARGFCAIRSRNSGFSLIELAITLVIVGVLASSVLVPLVSQMAARNIAVTEKTLSEIKDALVGFAAATGRLPCPASDTGGSAINNGAESFTLTAPVGTPANGKCESFYGYLPAVTLGINPVDDRGYAVDGWGSTQNRIRYAVSNRTVNGIQNPFTSANGMRNATMSALSDPNTTFFHVCSSGVGVAGGASPNCGAALTLTSKAPVVIWSLGANAATGGASTDEAQNPNPNGSVPDVIFVSHSMSAIAANPFDDLVTWVGVPTLFNRMIASGQLP